MRVHLFGVRAIRRDGDASSTPVHYCSSSIALHLTFFPPSGCRCPPRKGSLKPRRGEGPSTPQSTSKFFSALRLHLYLTTTALHANDHKLSRTPQLYSFPVTDSCLTSDHAWSISKDPRLAGDAQKGALPFPRITRPLQTDDEYCGGLILDKVRHQSPPTQLPQRLHTMKSITLFRRFP